MGPGWEHKFLASIPRADAEQEKQFLALADETEGQCSLGVVRILFKSFQEKDDYGTQERVVSVLASADKQDFMTALLEELPRLLVEAPDWAAILVGQEVDRRPEFLMTSASQSGSDSRAALRDLLARPDVQEMYPGAAYVLSRMQ